MTIQQINASRTKKGGFTAKQLAAWGIPWPPPKGWKKLLLGKTLKPLPEYVHKDKPTNWKTESEMMMYYKAEGITRYESVKNGVVVFKGLIDDFIAGLGPTDND